MSEHKEDGTGAELSVSGIKQVFTVNGINFDSKAEAINYIRKPKVEEALNALPGITAELKDWLLENQEQVEVAFETGTIKRVTKSESAQLAKALAAIVEANDPKFAFVSKNAISIQDSFRWPSVKRLTDEEKIISAKASLYATTDEDEGLVTWILDNKVQILEAFQAGIEKRVVSAKATEALAAYREKMAAAKAAAAEKAQE